MDLLPCCLDVHFCCDKSQQSHTTTRLISQASCSRNPALHHPAKLMQALSTHSLLNIQGKSERQRVAPLHVWGLQVASFAFITSLCQTQGLGLPWTLWECLVESWIWPKHIKTRLHKATQTLKLEDIDKHFHAGGWPTFHPSLLARTSEHSGPTTLSQLTELQEKPCPLWAQRVLCHHRWWSRDFRIICIAFTV